MTEPGHCHRQREHGEDQLEDFVVVSSNQTFLSVNNEEVAEHQIDADKWQQLSLLIMPNLVVVVHYLTIFRDSWMTFLESGEQ